MKRIVIGSLIAASFMFGADGKHIQEDLLQKAGIAAYNKDISAGSKEKISDALKNTYILNDASKYNDIVNELVEADLITGAEDSMQKDSLPVLLKFKHNNKDCNTLGSISNDNASTPKIRLMRAQCEDESFQVNGYFVDKNKNLGPTFSYNKDTNKYKVQPQNGFLMISKVESKINDTLSNSKLKSMQLYKANISTSVTISASEKDSLPVLISLENNGITCNAIGFTNPDFNSSGINLSTIKCGESLSREVKGWFIANDKMIKPLETINNETNSKTIPIQSGYVLLMNNI